jgi:hypothetical protein
MDLIVKIGARKRITAYLCLYAKALPCTITPPSHLSHAPVEVLKGIICRDDLLIYQSCSLKVDID